MKRLYWISFVNIIALLSLTVLGSYLDALCFEKGRWISLVLAYAYVGGVFYFAFRKSPVTLTEEELHAPVPERQDFSPTTTKRNWITLVMGVLFFVVAMLLFPFAYIDLYEIFKGVPIRDVLVIHGQTYIILFKSITFWIVMVLLVILIISSNKRMSRNKYIVDGNLLIIQENLLFKAEEEIRIPIDTIDEVYLRFAWSQNPSLHLDIQGIKRTLYAGTNSLALAKAILQHKKSA